MTDYGYGWDSECQEYTFKEAKQTAKEYRENIQAMVKIVKKRERI